MSDSGFEGQLRKAYAFLIHDTQENRNTFKDSSNAQQLFECQIQGNEGKFTINKEGFPYMLHGYRDYLQTSNEIELVGDYVPPSEVSGFHVHEEGQMIRSGKTWEVSQKAKVQLLRSGEQPSGSIDSGIEQAITPEEVERNTSTIVRQLYNNLPEADRDQAMKDLRDIPEFGQFVTFVENKIFQITEATVKAEALRLWNELKSKLEASQEIQAHVVAKVGEIVGSVLSEESPMPVPVPLAEDEAPPTESSIESKLGEDVKDKASAITSGYEFQASVVADWIAYLKKRPSLSINQLDYSLITAKLSEGSPLTSVVAEIVRQLNSSDDKVEALRAALEEFEKRVSEDSPPRMEEFVIPTPELVKMIESEARQLIKDVEEVGEWLQESGPFTNITKKYSQIQNLLDKMYGWLSEYAGLNVDVLVALGGVEGEISKELVSKIDKLLVEFAKVKQLKPRNKQESKQLVDRQEQLISDLELAGQYFKKIVSYKELPLNLQEANEFDFSPEEVAAVELKAWVGLAWGDEKKYAMWRLNQMAEGVGNLELATDNFLEARLGSRLTNAQKHDIEEWSRGYYNKSDALRGVLKEELQELAREWEVGKGRYHKKGKRNPYDVLVARVSLKSDSIRVLRTYQDLRNIQQRLAVVADPGAEIDAYLKAIEADTDDDKELRVSFAESTGKLGIETGFTEHQTASENLAKFVQQVLTKPDVYLLDTTAWEALWREFILASPELLSVQERVGEAVYQQCLQRVLAVEGEQKKDNKDKNKKEVTGIWSQIGKDVKNVAAYAKYGMGMFSFVGATALVTGTTGNPFLGVVAGLTVSKTVDGLMKGVGENLNRGEIQEKLQQFAKDKKFEGPEKSGPIIDEVQALVAGFERGKEISRDLLTSEAMVEQRRESLELALDVQKLAEQPAVTDNDVQKRFQTLRALADHQVSLARRLEVQAAQQEGEDDREVTSEQKGILQSLNDAQHRNVVYRQAHDRRTDVLRRNRMSSVGMGLAKSFVLKENAEQLQGWDKIDVGKIGLSVATLAFAGINQATEGWARFSPMAVYFFGKGFASGVDKNFEPILQRIQAEVLAEVKPNNDTSADFLDKLITDKLYDQMTLTRGIEFDKLENLLALLKQSQATPDSIFFQRVVDIVDFHMRALSPTAQEKLSQAMLNIMHGETNVYDFTSVPEEKKGFKRFISRFVGAFSRKQQAGWAAGVVGWEVVKGFARAAVSVGLSQAVVPEARSEEAKNDVDAESPDYSDIPGGVASTEESGRISLEDQGISMPRNTDTPDLVGPPVPDPSTSAPSPDPDFIGPIGPDTPTVDLDGPDTPTVDSDLATPSVSDEILAGGGDPVSATGIEATGVKATARGLGGDIESTLVQMREAGQFEGVDPDNPKDYLSEHVEYKQLVDDMMEIQRQAHSTSDGELIMQKDYSTDVRVVEATDGRLRLQVEVTDPDTGQIMRSEIHDGKIKLVFDDDATYRDVGTTDFETSTPGNNLPAENPAVTAEMANSVRDQMFDTLEDLYSQGKLTDQVLDQNADGLSAVFDFNELGEGNQDAIQNLSDQDLAYLLQQAEAASGFDPTNQADILRLAQAADKLTHVTNGQAQLWKLAENPEIAQMIIRNPGNIGVAGFNDVASSYEFNTGAEGEQIARQFVEQHGNALASRETSGGNWVDDLIRIDADRENGITLNREALGKSELSVTYSAAHDPTQSGHEVHLDFQVAQDEADGLTDNAVRAQMRYYSPLSGQEVAVNLTIPAGVNIADYIQSITNNGGVLDRIGVAEQNFEEAFRRLGDFEVQDRALQPLEPLRQSYVADTVFDRQGNWQNPLNDGARGALRSVFEPLGLRFDQSGLNGQGFNNLRAVPGWQNMTLPQLLGELAVRNDSDSGSVSTSENLSSASSPASSIPIPAGPSTSEPVAVSTATSAGAEIPGDSATADDFDARGLLDRASASKPLAAEPLDGGVPAVTGSGENERIEAILEDMKAAPRNIRDVDGDVISPDSNLGGTSSRPGSGRHAEESVANQSQETSSGGDDTGLNRGPKVRNTIGDQLGDMGRSTSSTTTGIGNSSVNAVLDETKAAPENAQSVTGTISPPTPPGNFDARGVLDAASASRPEGASVDDNKASAVAENATGQPVNSPEINLTDNWQSINDLRNTINPQLAGELNYFAWVRGTSSTAVLEDVVNDLSTREVIDPAKAWEDLTRLEQLQMVQESLRERMNAESMTSGPVAAEGSSVQ